MDKLYVKTGSISHNPIINSPRTYNVLGKDIKVPINNDIYLSMIISSINIIGKPYYDEIRKQGIILPNEITSHLDASFRILDRDNKIDSIIK
jgi:hypothetical protein